MNDCSVFNLLATKKYIFWDFDGVIKNSVEVKSNAFVQMFESFGSDVAKKVKSHHEANGGMSRFDKLPIYLEWSGQSPSLILVDEYSEKFSVLVKEKVIESDWVPGVFEYILKNSYNQTFFLVTATPQSEIEEILESLQIRSYFCKVVGAPIKKDEAISVLLCENSIEPNETVMIGDSSSDYDAAIANCVPFILRRTNLNLILQENLSCLMIEDFCNE